MDSAVPVAGCPRSCEFAYGLTDSFRSSNLLFILSIIGEAQAPAAVKLSSTEHRLDMIFGLAVEAIYWVDTWRRLARASIFP